MFTFDEIKTILDNFSTAGRFTGFSAIDEGHINNTLRVEYTVGDKKIYHLFLS